MGGWEWIIENRNSQIRWFTICYRTFERGKSKVKRGIESLQGREEENTKWDEAEQNRDQQIVRGVQISDSRSVEWGPQITVIQRKSSSHES